jgi:2-oxoglutarate dehydrogenase E2 component (dihydrolipoamide succinyltransferase)
MAIFEVVMPKLGESIIEATITKWLKKEGDTVVEDDAIVEIATDKVDSEIPSPVEGKLTKVHFKEGDVVPVGAVIALIEMDGEGSAEIPAVSDKKEEAAPAEKPEKKAETPVQTEKVESMAESGKFYSPLVKSIAKKENIQLAELDSMPGSGKEGRFTKDDLLKYIENRKSGKASLVQEPKESQPQVKTIAAPAIAVNPGDEIIEMDRMRKLIADHMVMSKQVSPHVTMFHEVDMTRVVNWRNKIKEQFEAREGTKLTFTPIFVEAATRSLRDFPLVNASVDGYKVIKRKNINIGMATALPNGNLIVPVIKNADTKNLAGLAKDVNDLANRARNNKLNPDDISGGTFTITNFGQFGNLTGAPIINQPQVAILGVGTIIKKPMVIETETGDMIGIRHIMILSLAFDHRIVDGALGGMFLQRIAKYLQEFDVTRIV